MRGRKPRIHPQRRPKAVAAPQGVGPRVKPAGDDSKVVT
jgi:hypothetical protein